MMRDIGVHVNAFGDVRLKVAHTCAQLRLEEAEHLHHLLGEAIRQASTLDAQMRAAYSAAKKVGK